ncbi:MAG: trypsin-like peptidase domain-containing protein [Clostridiales Family XIII bacterium]|jgi:serine protease Do|nr:trypsin-like peptidase domain-containing protein [Clostridiales Family XIII bacterium]
MWKNEFYEPDETAYAPKRPSRYLRDVEIRANRARGKGIFMRRGFAALLLAGCAGMASVFGFVGGYAANRAGQTAYAAADGTEIPYQSILRTVAASSATDAAALTIAETAAAVKESVVEITTETVLRSGRMGQFVSTGAGSGVIISADGYIVTNNHVISEARNITVRLTDGSEFSATVTGADSKTDLAVLKIGAAGLQPAVLGNSSSLAVGDPAVVIGNPLGELGGTVTFGIISALDREIAIDGETMSLLQTDAAINPGNSGGGLFNLYGELIGIVNAKSFGSDIEGLGFAIPVDIAKPIIEELIFAGYVTGRVSAGLTLLDIRDAQTARMYRVSALGLYIYKSSNAALLPGDRITAVNGATVAGLSDFNAKLTGLSVGDHVKITVVRGGKSVTADIVLTELRT